MHYGYTYTLHIYTYIYIYIYINRIQSYIRSFFCSCKYTLRAKEKRKELFPSRGYVAYRVSRNYYHFFLVTSFLIIIFVIKAHKILLKRLFKIGFINFFYMRSLLREIIRSTFNRAYILIVAADIEVNIVRLTYKSS